MVKTLSSPIFLAVLTLFGVGLVQVYSSSYIYAIEAFGNGLMFFQKQGLFVAVALVLLVVVSQLKLEWVRQWGWILWVLAIVGLILTFVPGVAARAGGANRWLSLPLGFRLEPSEFLKISLSLFIGSLAVREQTPMRYIPMGMIFVLFFAPFFLLLEQPDFGSFSILSVVVLLFLFVYGLKWRYLIAGFSLSIPAFYFLVMSVPYRRARVLSFMDPWSDPEVKGFQVIQSLLSFSSGGFSGVGLGQGQGKLFFLPEAHTDFTLAVLGEETGFIGYFVVMAIYGLLIFKGLQLATKTHDRYARGLALGLTSTFALNVFINVGVALGMLPTKGLTLPFMSYGGSSLFAMAILFGLLLNIERAQERPLQKRYGVPVD